MAQRAVGMVLGIVIGTIAVGAPAVAQPPTGYYRQPSVHAETVVFVAEGDLWKVPLTGGSATRLTSHPGSETKPALSPDGGTVAFSAQYEGPTEVYTMPIAGGLPHRLTYDGGANEVIAWTPRGEVLYATQRFSTLPAVQLVAIDPATGSSRILPLAQASDGCFDDEGRTLFFTRLPFQGSQTKRYQGGTAENLWKYVEGAPEAVPLTAAYKGISRRPMWWKGRVYFVSDRDGTMNLWSMKPDGTDPTQHTRHAGWDVASPSLSMGKIAYQLQADLRVFDVATGQDVAIPIALDSDLDQTREKWIKKPMDYLSALHVSPDGDRVVLTARGQVFVAPHRQGRIVEASHEPGVRYRDARFMPDGKTLLAMSDESGEIEFWTLPANGVGPRTQLTKDGVALRWEGIPSPDGKWIAHHDKEQRLWLYDVGKKTDRKIDESAIDAFADLRFSPDSQWLAYVAAGPNLYRSIKLARVGSAALTALTSDRFDSYSPAWSPDGKWLYFVSDRNFESLASSPWGPLQPEPYWDKQARIYQIPLKVGTRSPFAPLDELHPAQDDKKKEEKEDGEAKDAAKKDKDKNRNKEKEKKPVPKVEIDLEGIEKRLLEVPLPPGNYDALVVTEKSLFWRSTDTSVERKQSLVTAPIARENVEVKTFVPEIKGFELSQDGLKFLVRKGDALYILDATASAPADLDKKDVSLSGWTLSVIPRVEWRQMLTEAWRLERDYFYARNMHGADWPAILRKYLPLADRVTTRAELSNAIAQMVSELSALHTFVRGGDLRKGEDDVAPGSLGADLARDEARGGWRVARVYESDPDYPDRRSPLTMPGVDVALGDVVEQIDGVATLSVPDPALLLRNKTGRQVLLRVRPAAGGPARDVIATPIALDAAATLRYHAWEYTRRMRVEELGRGEIGYVHLRAMGGDDYADWARGFYPVFARKGLIIDVRNNRGGNIDSWILEKLLRKAWFFWNQHAGRGPVWNMQYAFRGHIAVLCNEFTASDGEAFTEGIKRLGIGKVIGTRTWGGEIWLSSNNYLVDGGIATAAEFGVFGPEGEWLIEGHGVDPDVVVDNLPHATFGGEDAQLAAAVVYLQKEIAEKPIELPPVPQFPDKSWRGPASR